MKKNATLLVALLSLAAVVSAQPAPQSADTDSSGLKSSQDVELLRRDPEERKKAAARMVEFVREQKFYDEAAVAADGKLPGGDIVGDFWSNLQASFEKALAGKKGPVQGAAINEVLSRKKGEALASSDGLKLLRGDKILRTVKDAQNGAWTEGFLAKAYPASVAILQGEKQDPAELGAAIRGRGPVGTTPSVGQGGGGSLPGSGGSALGSDVAGMYQGLYPQNTFHTSDGRTLSIRFYADYTPPAPPAPAPAPAPAGRGKKGEAAPAPEPQAPAKGEWTYRIGIFDVTYENDVHGVYVPIKGHGDTTFTMQGADGKNHDYTLSFIPDERNPADGRAWKTDTRIRIAEPKSKPHDAWLNDLVYERAESAKLGGRMAEIDGQSYYVAAQGGDRAGLAFFNVSDVNAMLAGRMHPRKVVAEHIAYTNEPGKEGMDRRLGDKADIDETGYQLIYDPKTRVWGQPKKGKDAKAPASGASTGGGAAPPLEAPPVVAQGPDRKYPASAFGWSQNPINNYLASQKLGYRMYDSPQGRVYAVKLDAAGKPAAVKAAADGSPAPIAGGAQGRLDHVGPLLIFGSDQPARDAFLAAADPYSDLGYSSPKDFVVRHLDYVNESLLFVLGGPGSEAEGGKVAAAMMAKLKEVGGDFIALHGRPGSGGKWTFALETSTTGKQWKLFWGQEEPGRSPSSPAAAAPAAPKTSYVMGKKAGGEKDFDEEVRLGQSEAAYKLVELADSGGVAVYMDEQAKECVANWRVLDGSGKPTNNYTGPILVHRKDQPGGNPCTEKGWVFSSLQLTDPGVFDPKTVSPKWEDGKLTLYRKPFSSANKRNEALGTVVEKKK